MAYYPIDFLSDLRIKPSALLLIIHYVLYTHAFCLPLQTSNENKGIIKLASREI